MRPIAVWPSYSASRGFPATQRQSFRWRWLTHFALFALCIIRPSSALSLAAAALIELHSYSSPSSVLSRRCYQAVTHRRGLEAKFEHLTHRHILTALATYLPLLICRLTD